MKKILSLLLVALMLVGMLPMNDINANAADDPVTFQLGANGSATHNDGSEKTTYTETVSGYTLSITGGTKMYTGARDAKGNSCIKLGTSKAVGGFTFTVPSEVSEVVICVAKYKSSASKVNINGTDYTLTKNSNDGAYDEITVDTSSNKTVKVTTVASSYRAMVNSITFAFGDDACAHANTTTTTADATCTAVGSETVVCDDCGKTISTTEIPMIDHNFVDGYCSVCKISKEDWESEPDTTDPSEPEATDPEPTEAPTSSSATITFDDTTKRTTFTTSQQVWEENGITVTNNKSSSTSNVADYVQPARFYKSSNLIIKYNAKMTKIEVNCNTADYATAFGDSISDTNATVTVSDKVVSIVFTEAVESFTIASMSAQVRVDSINVYAEEGAHVHSWGEWTGTEATCTTAGE